LAHREVAATGTTRRILLAIAVVQWWGTGWGPLNYAETMRWVIPGATLSALGFQTVLSSFFISILGMHRK